MTTKDKDEERRKELYEAAAPIIEDYTGEIDLAETHVERLNRNLRQSLAMRSAMSGKPSVGGSPRLLFERHQSPIPDLVTATLVWKIDGDLQEEEELTGMFDDAGIMHQCTEDGHYTRDNFDEALPTATSWVKDQIWKVEVEARKFRSKLNEICAFESRIEKLSHFPEIEIPGGKRSESAEKDEQDEL